MDPLIKSQLFIRNRLFHASANTRPAVRDCVMMLEFFSRTERAVTEQTADRAHMTDKPPSRSRSTLRSMHNGKRLVAAIVTNGMIDC